MYAGHIYERNPMPALLFVIAVALSFTPVSFWWPLAFLFLALLAAVEEA